MRGLKTTVFGIITVSVDVRIVNLFVFLAIYISWFISKFHRLHIRVLCNFFGQEDRRPPQVRMCPYAYVNRCASI